MPYSLEELSRNLSPQALDIYKKQVSAGVQRGDPTYTRLVSTPEFASLFGKLPTATQPANAPETQQNQQARELLPWAAPKDSPWWQTALWAFGMPFNTVSKTLGALVTEPIKSKPSMEGTEDMNWLEKELVEYERYKLPYGVKFWTEMAPWLAVPAIGAVGKGGTIAGALGKLGKGGQVAGKALQYSPWGLTEAATGKVVGAIAKPITSRISQAVKIAPKVTSELMPDLQDINQAIDIASSPDNLRKLAGMKPFQGISKLLAGKSAVMKSPADKAVVGRQILLSEGQTKATALMARLKQIGDQDKIFGKIGADGRFASGEVSGILQNELFTNPQKYINKLNPAQKQWLQVSDDIERAKLGFLKRNGIKVKELSFEEGGTYAGQRIAGKFTPDGEFQDVAYISAGARMPGAKASFLKTRIFKDPEEAAKEGYRYLTRDEALTLNVQAAYNTVANKKSTDWLLSNIPYRTAGATELTRAKRLSQVMRGLTKGKTQNVDRLRLVSKEYPEIARKLTAVNKIQDPVIKASKLGELNIEAEAILQKAQLEWNALSRTEQTAMRAYSRSPKFGEATVRAPAFQGKILTGEDAPKISEMLNKEFNPTYSEALGAINKVNAIGRAYALTGDASPFGIQLILLPWKDPKAFASSVKGFLKAFNNKEFLANYISRNADIINNSPDLLISNFEATEAMRAGGILSKIPIIKNILQPFNRSYDAAMTVAGVEMKKSLMHLATTPEKNAMVDAFINEMRGVISTARMGIPMTQRQLESALILAPKYNRAVGALLVDTVKGNLRGTLARDALLKGAIGISATATAISYAMGESTDEVVDHLNPASSKFLTWQIAGQNIGPGSKIRSILKLIADSTKNPEDLAKLSMDNPGLRFIRGNLAPLPSTGMDLLIGQNYIGDPTRDGMLNLSKTVIGENLVPIWMQSMIWEGGDFAGRGVRGATEFLGGRTYPMTPYQELEQSRDEIAQQTYGMNWNDIKVNMGELYQYKLEQSNPELKRLKEVAQKESSKMARGESAIWDSWNRLGQDIEERYRKAVTLASQEYAQTRDGETFRDKVDDASLVRREMFAQREQNPDFSEITESFSQSLTESQIKEMNPMDVLRREYYKIMYSNDMYDQYGNYRFDLADQREEQFVSMYGQSSIEYIQSFGGIKWEEPQELKMLRQARQVLKPYWDIETKVWEQMPPQLKQVADQISNLENYNPTEAKRLLVQYPQIVMARRRIAFLKKQLKMQNADIASALRMFY